jgi:hypothetical protein
MYRDSVEREMHDHIGKNWSHRNNNKRFKEKFVRNIRKTFSRYTTKDSYSWNITRNTEILQSEI